MLNFGEELKGQNLPAVSQQQISNYCTGKTTICRADVRAAIAKVLGSPVTDAWLGGSLEEVYGYPPLRVVTRDSRQFVMLGDYEIPTTENRIIVDENGSSHHQKRDGAC